MQTCVIHLVIEHSYIAAEHTQLAGASAGSIIAVSHHAGLSTDVITAACLELAEDCRRNGTRGRLGVRTQTLRRAVQSMVSAMGWLTCLQHMICRFLRRLLKDGNCVADGCSLFSHMQRARAVCRKCWSSFCTGCYPMTFISGAGTKYM